jgi:hypothetical protein
MLQQYHSELGEKALYKTTARYNPYMKKWAVRTSEKLKGQGIKYFEAEQGNTGRHIYYLTDKAFNKLRKTMNISQELLFD